jgi:translation initiation factor IF-2
VSQSDVLLADAAEAVIVAFRVGEDEKVRDGAATAGVEIISFDVIYDVVERIRAALEGMLEPELREEVIGRAEVRRTFYISRFGTIAGCYVTGGTIRRNARVRVLRDGKVLHEGALSSMRQEKSDVREVEAGRECGLNVEGFNDFSVGDVIEFFVQVSVKRTLSPKAAPQRAESGSGAQVSR